MPWEIDYALLSFIQLKKSKYFLSNEHTIIIDSVLNLSDKLIDWEQTKLPKDFFIQKYENISILLNDYIHNQKIIEGDILYGHLDLQKSAMHETVDYYITICPDMYFHEHLLEYIIQAATTIKNEYFVITPQICRMWDESWEILTHPKFAIGPHYGWEHTTDIFDVDYFIKTTSDPVKLTPINQEKWAGWFDLYSKSYYEKLAPVQEEWVGYGGWDYYGLVICQYAKQKGYDFQQYRLDGQVIFEYSVGPLRNDIVNGFSNYYKTFIVKKDVSEQREFFNLRLNHYIEERIKTL
jgi:hypothetical protein